MRYVGSEMLTKVAKQHGIHLNILIANTGLWAHPDVHAQILGKTKSAARYPNVRRVRVGKGERRGQILNGVRLDDNTYANRAIKKALGLHRRDVEGFETCHIWPRTCYDTRYHTAIANLVLLPRALAGLSDHDVEIQASLQYRAYELYGWYPESESVPRRPTFYPSTWREPELSTERAMPLASLSATHRIVTADQPLKGGTMKQRDMMHSLFLNCRGHRERVVRLYVEAEMRGEVRRKSNVYGLTRIEYARRLFADGVKKGWLKQSRLDYFDVRGIVSPLVRPK